MKLLALLFSFCISLTCYCQKITSVVGFDDIIIKGSLVELKEDSFSLLVSSNKMIKLSPEDILKFEFTQKKDNSTVGALLGVGIGMIPGILIITNASKNDNGLIDVLVTPTEVGLGFGITLAGGIVGGLLGYNLGKGSKIEIPIYGKTDLYKKQKEKIKSLGF